MLRVHPDGSRRVRPNLSRQHLIDEYRLVIRAVALGSGLPLFKDLTTPLPLTLVSATTYPDSTAIHVYRPRTPA